MNVKGTITEGGEVAPFALVYLSDSKGNKDSVDKFTRSKVDGSYSLDVPEGSFITVSFLNKKVTKKVDSPTLNFDIGSTELDEFVVVAKSNKKRNAILISVGAGLLITAVILALTKKKRK